MNKDRDELLKNLIEEVICEKFNLPPSRNGEKKKLALQMGKNQNLDFLFNIKEESFNLKPKTTKKERMKSRSRGKRKGANSQGKSSKERSRGSNSKQFKNKIKSKYRNYLKNFIKNLDYRKSSFLDNCVKKESRREAKRSLLIDRQTSSKKTSSRFDESKESNKRKISENKQISQDIIKRYQNKRQNMFVRNRCKYSDPTPFRKSGLIKMNQKKVKKSDYKQLGKYFRFSAFNFETKAKKFKKYSLNLRRQSKLTKFTLTLSKSKEKSHIDTNMKKFGKEFIYK